MICIGSKVDSKHMSEQNAKVKLFEYVEFQLRTKTTKYNNETFKVITLRQNYLNT